MLCKFICLLTFYALMPEGYGIHVWITDLGHCMNRNNPFVLNRPCYSRVRRPGWELFENKFIHWITQCSITYRSYDLYDFYFLSKTPITVQHTNSQKSVYIYDLLSRRNSYGKFLNFFCFSITVILLWHVTNVLYKLTNTRL